MSFSVSLNIKDLQFCLQADTYFFFIDISTVKLSDNNESIDFVIRVTWQGLAWLLVALYHPLTSSMWSDSQLKHKLVPWQYNLIGINDYISSGGYWLVQWCVRTQCYSYSVTTKENRNIFEWLMMDFIKEVSAAEGISETNHNYKKLEITRGVNICIKRALGPRVYTSIDWFSYWQLLSV